MDLVNLLYTYQGRINRAKWWLAVLVYVIAVLILWVLAMALGIGGAIVIYLAFYVAAAISGIMVGVKRLHDRNKSGWWMLLFYGVPFLAGIVQAVVAQDSALGLLLGVVSVVIAIWVFVEFGCLRGSIGPNQYGPDPLAPR
jgi:uncharacterized membrane protein YhaH (DUF805 family)